MPSHLLKSSPVDTTPPVVVLPPHIVEVTTGATVEQLDVTDELICLSQEEDVLEIGDSSGKTPTKQLSLHTPTSYITPDAAGSSAKSKRGKSTSKLVKSARRIEKGQRHSSKNGEETTKTPNGKKIKQLQQHVQDFKKLPEAVVKILPDYTLEEAPPRPNNAYIRYMERPVEDLAEEVEYDLDEEDCAWLELVNEERAQDGLQTLQPDVMELLMDRLEKESYFQMQSSGLDQTPLIDDDAVCCICMDGECQNSNAILFCDMCNLAVHQECYGVPYIPEGQWLCRRCLQSPSRAVDCVLCPNKGGAFKQTDDGRWAHVVCAIWIPEVCFANTVFLEPIDSVNNIPPARWKLCCYICKQKSVGACIQCFKTSCYTAFHVTCAQQAGLCMQMETVRVPSTKGFTVKKTAYCDTHAPQQYIKEREDSPTVRQKLKQTRKILAEKRSALPVVSIPTIPSERVAQISSAVSFARKTHFIKRLMAYWKLKRMSRNGVPLLRRLQAASLPPHSNSASSSKRPLDASQMEATRKSYAYFMRLRQDLEKVRLLCELIRKREKIKRELIHLTCDEADMRMLPFNHFLVNVVAELQLRDGYGIFAQPVDPEEVPDYLSVVKNPMDLQTMQSKVMDCKYRSLDQLQQDFTLMIENCMLYNSKETVFYRAAKKMQEHGGIIFREAQRKLEIIGFDPKSGTLLPEAPVVQVSTARDEDISKSIEQVLADRNRFSMSVEEHICLLQEIQDKSLDITHPTSRKKKYDRIKLEISRLRRKKSGGVGDGSSSGALAMSSSDLKTDVEEEGDNNSGGGASNSIRQRLRSVDDTHQPSRSSRRLSRSEATGSTPAAVGNDVMNFISRLDVANLITLAMDSGPSSTRPARGRPRKAHRKIGRRNKPNRKGGSSPTRGSPGRPRPSQHKVLRGTGRTRGGRSQRLMSLRRSTRTVVINQQNQTSPAAEKDAEQQQSAGSRHGSPSRGGTGSPTGRPRLTRERAVKKPTPLQVKSAILRGRSHSPKSIETAMAAAKTLICERGGMEKSLKRNMVNNSKRLTSPKLKKNTGGPPAAAVNNLLRGDVPVPSSKGSSSSPGASRIIRRNSAGKGSRTQNLLTDKYSLDVNPSSTTTPVESTSPGSPRRRSVTRRKLAGGVSTRESPLRNGPVNATQQGDQGGTYGGHDFVPTAPNGLSQDPHELTPVSAGYQSEKLVASVVSSSKRRLRGNGNNPPNVVNNNNNVLSGSLHHHPPAGLHLKKSDSFSVYRSGGDHDINSYSEGESGDEDEDEVEEEEDDDDDEDDDEEEEDEDDDDEEEDEEQTLNDQLNEEEENDENINNDADGKQEEDSDDDDSSGKDESDGNSDSSDSGSSSDSDSSNTSSSSISSSSSSSSKASSSSSITTPKPHHHLKAKLKRPRSSFHHHHHHHQQQQQHRQHGNQSDRSLASVSSSSSPPRLVRQQPVGTTPAHNNNNVLCNNKEKDKGAPASDGNSTGFVANQ